MQEGEEATTRGSRVQVVVRVRPVLPSEILQDVGVSCAPDGSKVQVTLPNRTGEKEHLPGASRSGAKSFKFDACLPGSTTQEDLFNTCGMAELVDSALDGYSVTIFAFGQTGSGKTHTMIGPRLSRAAAGGGGGGDGTPAAEDGVLPRCVQHAYESIAARAGEAEFTVTASCLELYNETVTDLLGHDKSKQLQVRKDERDGFQVLGLTQAPCPSAAAAMASMQRALQLRQTRGHRLNDYSSRSHCVVTFVFSSQECGGGGAGAAERVQGAKGGIRRYGKLVLVDLAGSERLKETGNTDKDAVRETGFINKSLFTLGQVLAALCARSSGASSVFVPYRDSKLTQLLWDGLRGSGRALMLACLGPTTTFADESLNTLHFASMAQRIKASPVVLLDPQDQLVVDLRNTIRQLQEENRQLAGSLQQLSSGADIQDIINLLPEKLRAAAGAPGAPPDTAPPAVGGAQRPDRPPALGSVPPLPRTAAAGLAGAVVGSSNSAPSTPWLSADDPQLPPTPSNAKVLKLQPLPAASFGQPQAQGKARLGGSSRSSQEQAGGKRIGAARSLPFGGVEVSPRVHAWAGDAGSASSSDWRQEGSAAGGGKAVPGRRQALLQPRGSGGQQQRRGSGGSRAGPGEARDDGGGGGSGRAMLAIFQDLAASPSSASAPRGGPAAAAARRQGGLPSPNPRSFSNPKLASMQARGGAAGPRAPAGRPPAPLLDAIEFPELAAMEAEFQSCLATATAAPDAETGAGEAGGAVRASVRDLIAAGGGAPAADPPCASSPEEPSGAADAEHADALAVKWARKNTWFGADLEMTSLAYQVHERLVDQEHVDPSSEVYYQQLELRVAAKFPDRWVAWRQHQQQREQPVAPDKLPAPADAATVSAFGRALRVSVKDALPAGAAGGGAGAGGGGGGGGGHSPANPVHGFRNLNARRGTRAASVGRERGGAPLSPARTSASASFEKLTRGRASASAASAAGEPESDARARSSSDAQAAFSNRAPNPVPRGQAQPATPSRLQQPSPAKATPQRQSAAASAHEPPSPDIPQTSPGAAFSGVNPFNLHALNAPAAAAAKRKPRNGRHDLAPGSPGGAGGSPAEPRGRARDLPSPFHFTSYEDMQAEYLRQRALVVSELKVAKEQAEAERDRIMSSIGKMLGGSRWRR